MVTPLYHCIAISLIGGIRCPLETSDTRTSGVINHFPGRFPRFLMLSSFSRRLVAMPSHHHLTPHFDHQNQNPQLSLYRAFHVLIITVCIAFMSRPRRPPLYSCIVFSSVPCTPLLAKKTPSLCTFGHGAQANVRPSRPTNLTDLKDPNIGCNL